MKIKTKQLDYDQVMALQRPKRDKPIRPNILFRALIPILSLWELMKVRFTVEKVGMERLGRKEPCLILMNHSAFIDLKIACTVLFPRPINIVTTADAFVGKNWLMRLIGCIPAQKFVSDPPMVRDMLYALQKNRSSVLMFPEASYSFDGTATTLPESLGKCLKMMKVPVVMIKTKGAFLHDPLYNNLQLRKVKVSARVEYLLSAEEIASKSTKELNEILAREFSFDNFRQQQQEQIRVSEPFRADFLNRVLYKCPHCMAEGKTVGKGTELTCTACGKTYTLTEFGSLEARDGASAFTHIPDWYAWERQQVRREILEGTYRLDVPVDIAVQVDYQYIYQVGSGRLVHDNTGFHLSGCDGKLEYHHAPEASYSLYSDYYWYELGDVICIGNSRIFYYCFPKGAGDVVAKTRLATEELYKITMNNKKKK